MGTRDNWSLLGQSPDRDLSEARLMAHHALQWVARVARGYLPAQTDDSHTSLSWDADADALLCQPLADGARLGLALDGLALVWLGGDGSRSCPLDGLDETKARGWVMATLNDAGLEEGPLEQPLPYELPDHAVAQGGAYAVARHADALAELAAWYASGAEILARLAEANAAIRPGPSPVRCWPHHFDLASLISLNEDGGEAARSIGVGLSPGDETYPQPYYYVTPWPYPDVKDLPPAHRLGQWHTEGFVAAIAKGRALSQAGSMQLATLDFLQSSVGVCRQLLDH